MELKHLIFAGVVLFSVNSFDEKYLPPVEDSPLTQGPVEREPFRKNNYPYDQKAILEKDDCSYLFGEDEDRR